MICMRQTLLLFYNKSLSVLENQNRLQSMDAAHCYNNIGLANYKLNNFFRAEYFFNQSFKLYQNYVTCDLVLDNYFSNYLYLEQLYNKSGDMNKLNELLSESISFINRNIGCTELVYADFARCLANTCSFYQDYDASISLYILALNIYQKSPGNDFYLANVNWRIGLSKSIYLRSMRLLSII